MNEFKSCGPGLEKTCFSIGEKGAKSDVSLWRPNRRTFAGDISGDVFVLNPGWTETSESMKPTCIELARSGMTALVIKHAIGQGAADRLFRAGERRAESTINVCNYLDNEYESYSIAGHSLGGIDSTRAIVEGDLRPKLLFLLASAGLIKSDNFQHVAPRVFKALLQEEKYLLKRPKSVIELARESIASVLKNPALTASEGWYAATHYVGRHINEIADSGVVLCNVMADEDIIFPYEQVLKDTEDLKIDVTKIFKEATHNFPFHDAPQLAQFVRDTNDIVPEILDKRASSFAITNEDIESGLFLRNG